MIEVLATLIPSLLWIAYRVLLIVWAPTDDLVEELSISVPEPPRLCLEWVSANLAILRWEACNLKYDDVHYTVLVNGKLLASVSGATCCKLTNLVPGCHYRLQVVARNPITCFYSLSVPLDIETIADDDRSLQTWTSYLTNAQSGDANAVDATNSRSLNVDDLTPDYIARETDLSALLAYSSAVLAAVTSTLAEIDRHVLHSQEALQELRDLLQALRQEYEQECDLKSRNDANVKTLERKKVQLTYQKSKLLSQISSIKSILNSNHQKVVEKQRELQNVQQRRDLFLGDEESEQAKIRHTIDETLQKITSDRAETQSLDDSLKKITNEKRRLAKMLSDLKPLVASVSAAIATGATASSGLALQGVTRSRSENAHPDDLFTGNGLVNPKYLQLLSEIYDIEPEWRNEVLAEVELCRDAETTWRDQFRTAIKRYVQMHSSLEIAKMNRSDSYDPVKLTEYQASIDYAGIANAIGKRTGAKPFLRNFSPPSDTAFPKKETAGVAMGTPQVFTGYSDIYGVDTGDKGIDATRRFDLPLPSPTRPFASNILTAPLVPAELPALVPAQMSTLLPTPMAPTISGGSTVGGPAPMTGAPAALGNGTIVNPVPFSVVSTVADHPETGLFHGATDPQMPPTVVPPGFRPLLVNSSLGTMYSNFGKSSPQNPPVSGFPYDDSVYALQLPVTGPNAMMGASEYYMPMNNFGTGWGASSMAMNSVSSGNSTLSSHMHPQFGLTLSMPDLHDITSRRIQSAHTGSSFKSGDILGRPGMGAFAPLMGEWPGPKFGAHVSPPISKTSVLWSGDENGGPTPLNADTRIKLGDHTRSVSVNSHIWRSSEESAPVRQFDLGAVNGMMSQDDFDFGGKNTWG